LFSAIIPSDQAIEDLAGRVAELTTEIATESTAGLAPPADLRWVPPDRWHITLGFFGDDDHPRPRGRWLTRRADGLAAPRLRLAGSDVFGVGRAGGVLWVGVTPDTEAGQAALAALASAGGADRRRFRAHLTVARWRTGAADRSRLRQLFADYAGPWFTPTEAVLIESTPGPVYTPLLRVPLTHA
jgi:2'-5' RNA ligase